MVRSHPSPHACGVVAGPTLPPARPAGGKFILSQSNRCFPSKAIAMWLRMDDAAHLQLIGAYFKYTSLPAARWSTARAYDLGASGPGAHDPFYVVEATALAADSSL